VSDKKASAHRIRSNALNRLHEQAFKNKIKALFENFRRLKARRNQPQQLR
jgi:uncharacterized small protein (DUF1192 family)